MKRKDIIRAAHRSSHSARFQLRSFFMFSEYVSYYWSGVSSRVTYDEWMAAAKVLDRYHRFFDYMTEVRHDWERVDEYHFADNSVEQLQKSRLTGETRRVMLKAPSGDVCF